MRCSRASDDFSMRLAATKKTVWSSTSPSGLGLTTPAKNRTVRFLLAGAFERGSLWLGRARRGHAMEAGSADTRANDPGESAPLPEDLLYSFHMEPRSALVTGATSGIGEATARQLASEGYSLWLTFSSRKADAEGVGEECRRLGAPEVKLSQLDLRDSESIAKLVEGIAETWGSLDVLVNNGGVSPYTPLDAITEGEWDFVLETNARGTFFLTRGCLSLLRQATGDRSIVNLSSLAGQVGGILASVHYASSKAAILAMTRSFARLLAPEGIRVNAVSPGFITTPMTNQLDAAKRDTLSTQVPLGSFGEAADVAWVISSLVSPHARFVTGVTYDVNGGVRME